MDAVFNQLHTQFNLPMCCVIMPSIAVTSPECLVETVGAVSSSVVEKAGNDNGMLLAEWCNMYCVLCAHLH